LCSPPSLELQNHREFDEKLVELVKSMWSLGSLGYETSREALTFNVSVFLLAFKTRTTSYNLLSWVFLIVITFETKTMSYVHHPSSFVML
jgi:hypothetical protein